MKKYKFDYDNQADSLFIYAPTAKSSGSIELGDIIIDLNNEGKFVGIEILNATSFLTDITEQKNTKSILKNLIECNLKMTYKKGITTIMITLLSNYKMNQEIKFPFIVADNSYESPVVAY
jgi:uncharacterized protein YuzE